MIELFNRSATEPVLLQGIYIATSNSLHQITSLSFVPPLGYLTLFADEGIGPDHLDLKLSASGNAIVLSDAAGEQIQKVIYGAQTQGVSQGRLPDGNANAVNFPARSVPARRIMSTPAPARCSTRCWRTTANVSVGGQFVDFIEIYNPGAAASTSAA